MADVDILERLSSFIDYESPQLAEFLYGLWGDQANAITYHELRDAIMDGSLSLEYLRDWQQDYSKFIVEAYKPVAEKAIAQAAADLRTEYGAGFHDPMAAKVDSFIQEHGGQLIRQVSVEQYNAVNTLVRQAALTNTMTVDQLARVIRPCVGLTTRQAQTTKHFYQSLVDDGYSHKEAYKRQLVYAAKVHRRRAALIAQTELAYAYSAGWHATIEQNVEDGILPPGTKKVWLTAEDEKVCPECGKMNGEAVLWNEPFSNGSDYPPAHPNCRCHHKIEFVDLLTQTQIHEPPVERAQTQITADGEDYAEEEYEEEYSTPMARGDEPTTWGETQQPVTDADRAELVGYAESRGIHLRGFEKFDGDPEAVKEFIDGMHEVASEYPEVYTAHRGGLQLVYDRHMSPDDYADAGHRTSIRINADAYRNRAALEADYAEQVRLGRFPAGTTYRDIPHHEMGHVLDNVFKFPKAKVIAGIDRGKISKYAATEPTEGIAESFSSVMAGTPTPEALTIWQRCAMIVTERRGPR